MVGPVRVSGASVAGMAKFKWNRDLSSVKYGQIAAGDVTDMPDGDAERYATAGWGTVEKPPARKAAARADDR